MGGLKLCGQIIMNRKVREFFVVMRQMQRQMQMQMQIQGVSTFYIRPKKKMCPSHTYYYYYWQAFTYLLQGASGNNSGKVLFYRMRQLKFLSLDLLSKIKWSSLQLPCLFFLDCAFASQYENTYLHYAVSKSHRHDIMTLQLGNVTLSERELGVANPQSIMGRLEKWKRMNARVNAKMNAKVNEKMNRKGRSWSGKKEMAGQSKSLTVEKRMYFVRHARHARHARHVSVLRMAIYDMKLSESFPLTRNSENASQLRGLRISPGNFLLHLGVEPYARFIRGDPSPHPESYVSRTCRVSFDLLFVKVK